MTIPSRKREITSGELFLRWIVATIVDYGLLIGMVAGLAAASRGTSDPMAGFGFAFIVHLFYQPVGELTGGTIGQRVGGIRLIERGRPLEPPGLGVAAGRHFLRFTIFWGVLATFLFWTGCFITDAEERNQIARSAAEADRGRWWFVARRASFPMEFMYAWLAWCFTEPRARSGVAVIRMPSDGNGGGEASAARPAPVPPVGEGTGWFSRILALALFVIAFITISAKGGVFPAAVAASMPAALAIAAFKPIDRRRDGAGAARDRALTALGVVAYLVGLSAVTVAAAVLVDPKATRFFADDAGVRAVTLLISGIGVLGAGHMARVVPGALMLWIGVGSTLACAMLAALFWMAHPDLVAVILFCWTVGGIGPFSGIVARAWERGRAG